VTEIVKMPGRWRALVMDHGWREVADTALGFVQRFVKPVGPPRVSGRSPTRPIHAKGHGASGDGALKKAAGA
jgi:hypothetical protein